jgi:hypothetical protein
LITNPITNCMKTYNRITISLLKFSLAIFSFNPSFGQDFNNDVNNTVFASKEIKTKTSITYVTKEANIIFPTALKGNEEQSLEYIEKFSKNRRNYLIRTYKRSKKYFPKVSTILRKYGLTKEYQVLLPLESGFNANAVSGAGAVGYWQIMDEVAQEYGLTYERQLSTDEKKKLEEERKLLATTQPLGEVPKKVIVKDDRKNFIKSTNTAARYLKDRTRNLGNDILLIVASYNCGIGNVWKAKQRTGLLNPSFWDAKKFLPAETQAYVMNFITLNVLFNNYQKFENNSLTFRPVEVKVVSEEAINEPITVAENSAMDFE